MKVGIVGYGFVGAAVAESFVGRVDLTICDVSMDARNRVIKELSGRGRAFGAPQLASEIAKMPTGLDAVFVCVATPPGVGGACDDSLLVKAVNDLLYYGITDTIISKCTAPVSVYAKLPSDTVAYSPEYLRAAHAKTDYANQSVVIVGANNVDLAVRVGNVYQNSSLMATPINMIAREAAVMAKYVHNVSLAVKVAVMNEMQAYANLHHLDWDEVISGLRGTVAAHSHTQVPGPDGRHGFGGACFPKDVAAYLADVEALQREIGDIPHSVINQAFFSWCQPDIFNGTIGCGTEL